MKIRKRSYPMDMLSFDDKGHSVMVSTMRNQIWVRVEKDGQCVHSQELTPAQFIGLLMSHDKYAWK